MPLVIHDGRLVGDIAYEIARLEGLIADLEKLGNGIMPTAGELAGAPLLESYIRAERPVLCLIGLCDTHPHLNGPVVVTTDIWILAEELGFARTLSRYYRLGQPRSGDGR